MEVRVERSRRGKFSKIPLQGRQEGGERKKYNSLLEPTSSISDERFAAGGGQIIRRGWTKPTVDIRCTVEERGQHN